MDIPIDFFVDVQYLMKLQKEGFEDDFNMLRENIRSLYSRGNAIDLHIHPHWMFASLRDNGYSFDSRYYTLSGFCNNNGVDSIGLIFANSYNFLKNQIMDGIDEYSINAYRAGGWSLTPLHEIKNELIQNHIRIDSSILPRCYSGKNDVAYYDFRKIKNTEPWFLDEKTCGEFDTRILEIPIYTIPWYFVLGHRVLQAFKVRFTNDRKFFSEKKKGKSCLIAKSKMKRLLDFLFSPYRLSLDSASEIDFVFKIIHKLSKKKKDSVVCLYFHPKLLTKLGINEIRKALNEMPMEEIKFARLMDVLDMGREVTH